MWEKGANLEITGKFGGQSLSEIGDGVVKVENSGVLQLLGLVDYGLHHIMVTVPAAHRSNPSECIHVPSPLLVEQVLFLTLHYVHLHHHPHTTISFNSFSFIKIKCVLVFSNYITYSLLTLLNFVNVNYETL